MRSKELRAKRAQLIADARKHIEGDNPTAEQNAAFDAAMAESDKVKLQIDQLERTEAVEVELSNMRDTAVTRGRGAVSAGQVEDEQARAQEVFGAWLRNGLEGLNPDDRRLAAQRLGPISGIRNAQGVGTSGAGGYTVPPAFMAELLVALKTYGGMREAARQIDTAEGQDIPWPTLDDTSNVGELLPENTQISTQDVAFGSVSLKSYTYSSKLVLVSWQLLQDSAFDVPGLLRDAFANRIGRITNTHFTVGTGTGQPQGAVTAATIGKTGTTGQTLSVTMDDLIDLEHSLDPSYRAGAEYMFHDSTLKVLRKLKDGQGRYIWQAGSNYTNQGGGAFTGIPDTLMGRPYRINQDVPVMAANAKSILLGNFKNYIIRNVRDMQVVRLNEKYADYLQTGFFAYGRFDGRLVSAAAPIKAYANSAT